MSRKTLVMLLADMKLIVLFISLFSTHLSFSNEASERLFNRLNSDFEFFSKYISSPGSNFVVYGNWEINYPSAATERASELTGDYSPLKDEWRINTLGGYFRSPIGGTDVQVLILCHELGHHLGGGPFKLDDHFNERWSSMEGQADYWATSTCVYEFLKMYPQYLQVRKRLDQNIIRACKKEFWSFTLDYKVCLFSVHAGFYMMKIHESVDQIEGLPLVRTGHSEPLEVLELDRNGYPSNQCRFDTFLNGATNQKRPKCWFKD